MFRRSFPFFAVLYISGIVIGAFAGGYLFSAARDLAFLPYMLRVFGLLLVLFAGFFIHTAAHEGGHLLFGILTGYGFISYRIGSLTIVDDGGRIRFSRYTVAGTGGQCLLSPPPKRADGSFPYIAYNLGGIAVNALLSAAAFALSAAAGKDTFPGISMLVLAIIGISMTLTNGLPFLGIDNDGRNIVSMLQDADARKAFYIQLSVIQRMSYGDRLRDFAAETFDMPDADLSRGITAAIPVFAADRLIDAGDFDSALPALEKLWADGRLDGALRGSVVCQLTLVRLLKGMDVSYLNDKLQKGYMRASKNSLLTLRTEYALERLAGGSDEKAAVIREKLEAALKAHPYKGEAEGERGIIALIDKAASEKEGQAK